MHSENFSATLAQTEELQGPPKPVTEDSPELNDETIKLDISATTAAVCEEVGVEMDVDLDACKRTQSAKEFSSQNDNVFEFFGAVISKNLKLTLFVTVPLLTIPEILFCVYNLQGADLWIQIVTPMFMFLPLILLVLLIFREPGYIPRVETNPHPKLCSGATCTVDDVSYRWCATCHIWKPPRVKHCRHNDACVRVFDHFCPWVGNTIGLRNYALFYGLITSLVVGMIFAFAVAIVVRSENDHTGKTVLFWFTVILCGLFGLLVFGLFCSSTCNLKNGRTTAEWLTNKSYNPRKGFFQNLGFFCSPQRSQLY